MPVNNKNQINITVVKHLKHIFCITLKYFYLYVKISFVKRHICTVHHYIAHRWSHCKTHYTIAVIGIYFIIFNFLDNVNNLFSMYRKLFDERLAELSLEVSPVVEIGDTYLLLELLELGLGISFLQDYVTKKAYEEGKIVYLDVRNFDVEVWRQLLYRETKWVSPAMKRDVDYCSSVSEKM